MGMPDSPYRLDHGAPAFIRGLCDLALGRVESSALPTPGKSGPSLVLDGAGGRRCRTRRRDRCGTIRGGRCEGADGGAGTALDDIIAYAGRLGALRR